MILVLAPGAAIDRVLRLDRLAPPIVDALALLAAGAHEDALTAHVPADQLARLHVALHRLRRAGAIQLAVRAGDRTLATLIPAPSFELAPPPTSALRLSRFACLRRDGDQIIVDSPRVRARLVLHDPALAAALVAPTGDHAVVTLAARAGFLVTADEDRDPALAGWAFHDLLFHARSQRGRHLGALGATYPLADRIAAPPAVAPPRGAPVVELPRPTTPRPEPSLADVMAARRSRRAHDDLAPIKLADLAALLQRCAGVRAVVAGERASDEISRRPYPSAGARYPLELYLAVRVCASLAPGLYHYDPLAHHLQTVRSHNGDVEDLITSATVGATPPQVVIVIAARFLRTTWKYASLAYAMIVQETGMLSHSLALVATALDLAACPVGGLDTECFARAAGTDPDREGAVAAIAIGSVIVGAPSDDAAR